MAHTELDLFLVLPGIGDARDQCVERLTTALASDPRVRQAHVNPETRQGGGTGRLCVHFDPEQTSLPAIRQAVEAAGARLADRYGHRLWQTKELRHPRRARAVAKRLRKMPGVLEAETSGGGAVRVEFDRETTTADALDTALRELGLTAEPTGGHGDADGHEHADGGSEGHRHGGIFGEASELIFVALCGLTLAAGWSLERWASVPAELTLGLFIASYFFGGFYTVREAWTSVRSGRFEIDFLMLVAAAGAAALGEWAEGALLLVLFGLGHALEEFAMGRASSAIAALANLAPKIATVRRNGELEEVAVETLVVGDIIVVKPHERLASDGFVVAGRSSVNQAPVTGESVPVDKSPVPDADAAADAAIGLEPEHRVFAGTINGAAPLDVKVTKAYRDTTLSKLVNLVTEAETMKSPTQRFTDKFERYFVPSVLALVVVSLFAWVVVDESFATSFYRAMAILVAASPCALAIATPSAVLSGVARAGRNGVLIKGGAPLEALGGLTAIAFDKTGTLTEGEPKVTDIVTARDIVEETLLRTAWAVESMSEHPLARAINRHAATLFANERPGKVEQLETVLGRGLSAAVDGETVVIGKDDLFMERGDALPQWVREAIDKLESSGRTTVIVQRDGNFMGVIGLMDAARDGVEDAITALRAMGIKTMIMLSGDSQRVATAVASGLQLDSARGDLLPEDKVTFIEKLAAKQSVAMVGDGVNDAPAMARASVGIAMGAAGSDVALETADVALMADDIAMVPFAVQLSRRTRSIIRQNVWLSLGMVAVLIPATISGLGIGPAVAMHEGSTLVVVFNALRLLR